VGEADDATEMVALSSEILETFGRLNMSISDRFTLCLGVAGGRDARFYFKRVIIFYVCAFAANFYMWIQFAKGRIVRGRTRRMSNDDERGCHT